MDWQRITQAFKAFASVVGSSYIFRRIALILPTLVGILLINFVIIQVAPGGPVDQAIARLQGEGVAPTAAIAGGGDGGAATMDPGGQSSYEFARGIDPDLIRELEEQFGFDKPAHVRFFKMLADYFTLDFGTSFYQDVPVIDLVIDRLPVSLSLGGATLLIVYLVSLPLGIAKAIRDGTSFDVVTSLVILVAYAIPGFVLAMLLVIVFCGGEFFDWFPLRGLISENYLELGFWETHRRPAVAPRHAGGGAGGGQLRDVDHADQELVPRRGRQAVRADRQGQGV